MPFPQTMEAITIAKTGDLDVIEKTKVPFPEVAPGNVVIKVRSINQAPSTTANLDDECRFIMAA